MPKYNRWEWIVIIIGLISVFFLFINIFTDLGDNTPPPSTDQDISLSDPANFLSIVASAVNSSTEEGQSIKILTNGQEFLPDLLDEINKAHQYIYITNYIWDDGQFGNTLFQALIDKAKEGVKVKILLDGVSGRHASDQLIEELRRSGGEVAFFRPVSWYNISRIDKRNHIRDFVIDGNVAYIGGIAISDPWLGNATSSDSWHDYMFKINGNMADRSAAVFDYLWNQTTGEITAPAFSTSTVPLPDRLQYIPLLSLPSPDISSNMEHLMWLSIKAATSSIYIENPYILPDQAILDLLKDKAESGVDITIIGPGPNIDAKNIRWASRSFYPGLINAGVKIYEYQPSRIHGKFMVVDGKWSIIGSANLDNRSSEINLEYVMGVMSQKFGKELTEKFLQDLNQSKLVTAKSIHSSFFSIPLQYISLLFSHQY